MSAISTSIQIDDRMSPVLSSITAAMNIMVSSFGAAQTASETAINAVQWEAAVQQVHSASAAVAQYQEELERVQNKPVSVPESTWVQASEPKVFTSTGADRFASEYQSANQMAQQLYQIQQAISAQANRMSVTPPGMLDDMASIQNRVQDVLLRIQELNNLPVNLRTEQTNNQLETLRGQLGQAVSIQDELNNAMSRMDISAANSAYQQLDSVVNSVERNVRDNTAAQEQFNKTVHKGLSAADGLGSRIKQFIGMYTGVQGIKMAVSFVGDTTSLQNVQSEAETKLGAIMRQRMGASSADIQSVKDLTAAQQGLGVVGDEVQLSGAQQLATFLGSTDALNTLIPAMNNLAVQQNGVNVSTQDAVNIGNLMGKVMQGQVGALTRVGVTFTEAQEKVLKYGNEQERAAILAEVITNNVSDMNAIMANTPQGQIQQMANTWGDIKEVVGARLYPALMQFFATVNANMPAAETAVMGFAGVLSGIIPIIGQVIESMVGAAGFIQDNWSWLGPVIGGVAAALIAYKGVVIAYNTVQAISNGLKAIAAARAVIKTGADLTEAAATATVAGAQNGLNIALLACPLTWIVIAIMAVVAAIAVWVYRVGGIKIAWLICVNAVLTQADRLRLGFATVWMNIQNGIDNMQYGFESFKTGVLNALGNLKVAGLTILENFINGAIDRVNSFISAVNSIAGTSIKAVAHVEFAANAALEEEASQQQRAAGLETLKEQNAADKQARQRKLAEQQRAADRARMERQAEIAASKAEIERKKSAKEVAEENEYGGLGAEIAGSTSSTAANTAAMKDSMDIMDQDLKYMRDAAEQEIINRFTLAELKVDVKNNNTLTKKTDFDDMGRALSAFTSEFMAAAAEGGHI